jgi:antitoxin component of RelBE/YafQ-DinJ toxin-antitoxin module
MRHGFAPVRLWLWSATDRPGPSAKRHSGLPEAHRAVTPGADFQGDGFCPANLSGFQLTPGFSGLVRLTSCLRRGGAAGRCPSVRPVLCPVNVRLTGLELSLPCGTLVSMSDRRRASAGHPSVLFRVRVNPGLLKEAKKVSAEIGTTPSEIVRLLFKQLVKRRAVPFPLNADSGEDEILPPTRRRAELWDQMDEGKPAAR